MTIEQWVALLGVAALILTATAGLTKAIADLIASFRRNDSKPAPDVGITAPVKPDDDIDYRAYEDMRARAERAERDRDAWMHRALGIDEDTQQT
ncbi:hypothetical protein [Microbacterium sp.]|uniref:hypothetical protein n=1 Tax=Microbacterium sp. TaxID=51671 RepID=UPI003F72A91D